MARFKRQSNKTDLKKLGQFLKNDASVKVGYFNTRYQDGTPVAYVASIQEFGSPKNNIPPRSFMRSTATEKAGEWRDKMAAIFRQQMTSTGSIGASLDLIGFVIEGDIAEKITQISTPPLKASTVAAKARKLADGGGTGSLDKPLVESGLLLNSVTHEVSQ